MVIVLIGLAGVFADHKKGLILCYVRDVDPGSKYSIYGSHQWCADGASFLYPVCQRDGFWCLLRNFDGEFPLAKLISGLLGGEEPEEKDGKFQQVVCPTCGMTYEKFVENSCFGCADCYSVFDLLIRDNIKQLQGSDCHKGKHPKIRPAGEVHQTEDTMAVDSQAQKVLHRDERTEEIRSLEKKLKTAVASEDYEMAARYRDQIRALREGTKTDA